MNTCVYICIYVSAWGKCESLWPTDSQYFWVTANQFRPIAKANRIVKRPFFVLSF